MRRRAAGLGALILLAAGAAADAGDWQPPIAASGKACLNSPARTGACFTVHGRLGAYLGNPTFRIWVTGTHRVLGVHSPDGSRDDDYVALPRSVAKALAPDTDRRVAFGDFTVCPLERERAGHMRPVCIAQARQVTAGVW